MDEICSSAIQAFRKLPKRRVVFFPDIKAVLPSSPDDIDQLPRIPEIQRYLELLYRRIELILKFHPGQEEFSASKFSTVDQRLKVKGRAHHHKRDRLNKKDLNFFNTWSKNLGILLPSEHALFTSYYSYTITGGGKCTRPRFDLEDEFQRENFILISNLLCDLRDKIEKVLAEDWPDDSPAEKIRLEGKGPKKNLGRSYASLKYRRLIGLQAEDSAAEIKILEERKASLEEELSRMQVQAGLSSEDLTALISRTREIAALQVELEHIQAQLTVAQKRYENRSSRSDRLQSGDIPSCRNRRWTASVLPRGNQKRR